MGRKTEFITKFCTIALHRALFVVVTEFHFVIAEKDKACIIKLHRTLSQWSSTWKNNFCPGESQSFV